MELQMNGRRESDNAAFLTLASKKQTPLRKEGYGSHSKQPQQNNRSVRGAGRVRGLNAL
jgi:hypothetical protein